MRILLSSNAPWVPSGYGQQAKFLVNSFQKYGHEVIFATNFGLQGGSIEANGVLYLPTDNTRNNETIQMYSQIYKPDVVISLADWYVLRQHVWGSLEMPWFGWIPIDLNLTHDETFLYNRIFKELLENCNVVTMTEFGTKEVKKFGYQPSAQIYHAVDHNIFKILDKTACREKIIPNYQDYDLIIGMLAANYDSSSDRKAFRIQFEALKIFAQNNPKVKILLYLHTDPTPRLGGMDLISVINDLNLQTFIDIVATSQIKISHVPFSQHELCELYNSFDILMNASVAEGFGIPIVEAQACGVPVITHNFSSMPELTHYGYSAKSVKDVKLDIAPVEFVFPEYVKNGQEITSEQRKMGTRNMPNSVDIAKGIEKVYGSLSEEKAKETHEWVADNFSFKVIGEAWEKALQS